MFYMQFFMNFFVCNIIFCGTTLKYHIEMLKIRTVHFSTSFNGYLHSSVDLSLISPAFSSQKITS